MDNQNSLPPGQYAIEDFPRFGLPQYAHRYRKEFAPLSLTISGDVANSMTLTTDDLHTLPRVQQVSDFHCVTTWTTRGVHWDGYRFIDFYESIIKPEVQPKADAKLVIFRSQDGFRAILPLADLLSDDVLLADTLNGSPLTAKHGAPLRLVMPAHYGYKNVKHLKSIEFCQDADRFRPTAFRFMDHPRARVALEERGRGLPGWLLRFLYRPLVRLTIHRFKRAMK